MGLLSKIRALTGEQDTRDILQKGLFAFLIRIGGLFFGYLFTLVIARQYGAEVNGIFSLSITMFMLITILSRAGFDISLTRIFSENESKGQLGKAKTMYRKALAFSVPVSVLLATAFYFSSPFMAKTVFQGSGLIPSFKCISIAIPAWTITMISAGALRGLGLSSAYTFYFNVGRFLFGIVFLLIATFYFLETDPFIPAASYTAGCIVLAIASYVHVHMQTRSAREESPANSLRQLLTFSAPMLLSSSMFFIMGWLDRIVLGIFGTEAEVGIYEVAFKLSTLPNLTLTAVHTVIAPKIAAHYYNKNFKQFNIVIKNSSLVIFLGALPILVVLFLFPKLILGLFGDEFTDGMMVLFILLVARFFSVLSGSVGNILQMTGNQKVFQNVLIFAVILNIVGNFILAPIYGLEGVAVANMIAVSARNILAIYMVRKYTGIFPFYNPFRLFR